MDYLLHLGVSGHGNTRRSIPRNPYITFFGLALKIEEVKYSKTFLYKLMKL